MCKSDLLGVWCIYLRFAFIRCSDADEMARNQISLSTHYKYNYCAYNIINIIIIYLCISHISVAKTMWVHEYILIIILYVVGAYLTVIIADNHVICFFPEWKREREFSICIRLISI